MYELFALLYESPYTFAAVVIALVIVLYVMIRLLLFVSRKRHPGKYISHILWKMKAKREKGISLRTEVKSATASEKLKPLEKDLISAHNIRNLKYGKTLKVNV